jgi:hypothetical protein
MHLLSRGWAIAVLVVSFFFSADATAQEIFDWTFQPNPDPSTTQTLTKSGITITYTSSRTMVSGVDGFGSNPAVFAQNAATSSVTVSFSQAVTLNSLEAFDFSQAGNWTFTPTGGSNSAVTANIRLLDSSPTDTPARTTVNLSWTGVTSFTVTAAKGSSNFALDRFSITLAAPANNPPVFTASGPFSVLEGATAGTTVGDVNANNGDGGGSDTGITYSITSGNTGNAFAINSSTGVITVNTASAINYESATSYTLAVQANDGGASNNTTSANVTINVTDVAPSTPVDSNAAANSVAENAANGTTVGVTASATDPNGGTVTYSLTDNAGGRFAINSSTGVVTVAGAIDYETATSYDITVQAADPASGGVKTSSRTFSISVTNVNEAPSLAGLPTDVTFTEDTQGQLDVSSGTFVDVDAGANPVSLTISASSGTLLPAADGALAFQGYGTNTVTLTGTVATIDNYLNFPSNLPYIPASNVFGDNAATLTFTANDGGNSGSGGVNNVVVGSVNIDITAVNDTPSFTKGADQVVNEDSGPHTITSWATAVSAGPTNESAQTLTFNVSNNNNGLFSSQPAIDSNGTLRFTPGNNVNGSATVTVSLSDNGGGADTSADQTFTITVNAVNDAPEILTPVPFAAPTMNEDGGSVTFSQAGGRWIALQDVDAGGADIEVELVANTGLLTLASTANVTFSTGDGTDDAQIVMTGTVANLNSVLAAGITFTPEAHANGALGFTLNVDDQGNTGGAAETDTQAFTVNVTAVNDTPSFTKGADQVVNEDAGAQTVNGWATAVSAGPANESGQNVTFQVTNSNNPLFAVQPAIASNGTLTYTPAANANGAATVTVSLSDNGGGADTSADQTFTITVNALNDDPTLTGLPTDVTFTEDTAGNLDLSAGAFGDVDAAANNVTMTLVASTGTMAATSGGSVTVGGSGTGTLTLTGTAANIDTWLNTASNIVYTPAANENGNDAATVTLTANDGGATGTGGGTNVALGTVNIDITAVNDTPSFTKGADQVVNEDAGAQTVNGWATAVSAGPANESGQNVTFQVTNSNNPLFAVQPAIASNGTLTYTPAANANGAATVTVSLSDNGGGADTSADQTVTITVNAVNDAPAITAPASVAIVEDTPHTFTGLGGITVADPDLAAGLLTVTLTATSTVDLGAPGAISITGGADGTNVVSFTGTIVQVNQALNGLVYTPTANQISGASLTIEVSDGGATGSGGVRTTTHVVNFPITSVNDTPVAASDAATTPEDTAVTIAVLANDVDADGDPLGVSILAPPANGTVTINPDATITYTPNANFFGTDRFDYTATDPSGASDSERVDITITAVNDLPVAGDDAASTNQDTAVTINVLANDSDVESTVSVSAVGTPSNGTAVLNVDGTVTYTPAQYWFGEDTFTYTLTDGTATSTGTVAVTVVEVNSAPVANDDATAVAVGGSIEVDVLANDTDPDGDTITLVSVDSPTAGAIDNLGNGRLRYTASASEAGTVTVSYTISDPAGRTSTANLIIDVYGPSSDGDGVADSIEDGAPNDGDGNGDGVKDSEQDNVASFPVAAGPHVGKFVTVGVNSPAKLTNAGSRANPSESDYPVGASSPVGFLQFDVAGLEPGASTVVTIDVPPGVNATSYLKYGRTTDNPEPHWYDFGYDGETGALVMNDKIYLFLKDGARGDDDRSENGIIVDPGTPVFGLNAAPVAVDDVLALDEDTSADIDVRANDSDPDGDALTVAVIEQPANGTVEVLQDGTLHYTPAADFFGDDAFTYQVGDDQGGADEATVQVTVSGTQDAPRTTDDSAETPEGTAVTVDIFQNDVDPDGDVFHLTSQGLPANGTSVYNDDGTVTYTPAPGFSGVDSWTYTISDGPGASGQTVFGRITVTVTAVQKAPVGVPDDIEGPEDELILFDPLDNDSDPDGDDIFVVSVTQPTEGGVVTLEQGLIELVFIEPDPDYSGTFTFTYTISDGERLSDPVLVTVTLLPVNDAPVFPTTEVIFESFDAITQLVEPVVVRFREASDVDDTELMYRWELSSTASFSDVVHAVEVVTLTTDETGLASFTVTADTLSEALFLEPGADVTLFQRMVAIDASDAETVSAAQQVTFVRPASVSVGQATELPTEVYLSGNYPNPFNPTTTIAFGLPEADAVRIEVYDMQGRLARILVNRTMEPGHHHVQVDLSGLSSGVYVYRLTTNTIVKTRTLQLLK